MSLKFCKLLSLINKLNKRANRLIVCLNVPEKNVRRIFARRFAKSEGDPRRSATPRLFSQAPRQAIKFEKAP